MPESPENTPVAGSSGSGTTSRSGSKLQRILTDVSNADRDFSGNVPELGVLGTTLEQHLRYFRTFDKFIIAVCNYSGRTYDHGADLKPALLELVDPYMILLKKLPLKPMKKKAVAAKINDEGTLSAEELKEQQDFVESECQAQQDMYDAMYEAELEVWKSDIKNFSSRKNTLESNLSKLFSLIIGQCTNAMLADIKTEMDYKERSQACDTMWLLRVLKKLCSGINSNHNVYLTAVRKLQDWLLCRQKDNESSPVYAERQALLKKSAYLVCGPILQHFEVENEDTPEDVERGLESALLLLNADRTRHAERLKEMEKSVELGDDCIPTQPHKALEILVANEERLRADQLRYSRAHARRNGVGLLQNSGDGGDSGTGSGSGGGRRRDWPAGVDKVPGRDGTLVIFKCHHCGKWGHKKWNCEEYCREVGKQ